MQFIDLKAQYHSYRDEILDEIQTVLESAQFIKGPAVSELESRLKNYTGTHHAIGCSSGTDALFLGLLAKEIKPGDEIIVPDFTFIATAEIVSLTGAVPVFVDIDPDTFTINPEKMKEKITTKTKGIIAVSLFGQCADFDAINDIATAHHLWVMEDAAQSFGARYREKMSCNCTDMAVTSFFPAKPLGCYGDGGAFFTNDDDLAAKVRILLNHGQTKRYHHTFIGINGRLDTLQAAILKVKLRHFHEECVARQKVAALYTEKLGEVVKIPVIAPHNYSVWAQYTVVHKKRDKIRDHLKEKGIPTAVHYPLPLHRQEAFKDIHPNDSEFPVANDLSDQVFSLPMHPFLKEADIHFITETIIEALHD